MQNLISQFSPYSCALDCFAHYSRERGNQINTEDILKTHRDICWNNGAFHTYGAIDGGRLKALAQRFLFSASDFSPKDEAEIKKELDDGVGVFILASNYRGNNHCMRAVGVVGNEVEILIPAFPYGLRSNATLSDIVNSWGGAFIKIK